MARDGIVTSPDGDRWSVRRRWSERPLPNLLRRFRKNADEVEETGLIPGLGDLTSTPATVIPEGWIGLALAVVAVFIFVLLIPLLGLALELIVLLLVFWSGLAGRVLLGRPWVVEAVNRDDGERSVAYAVKGFRRSGDAVAELAAAIAADGPPERLTQGERTGLPRPKHEASA